jgi:hypothetical protein
MDHSRRATSPYAKCFTGWQPTGNDHPVDRADPGGAGEVVDEPAARVVAPGRLQDARVVLEPAELSAAVLEAVRRDPAEEKAVGLVGVLRQIGVAALGVDDDGLVVEAAEGLDGPRVAVGAAVVGVDLEDMAVVLGHTVLAGPVGVLLAGQPGAPRGVSTSAVGGGTGYADPFGTAAVAVGLDDRAAAGRGGVVDEALGERDGVLPLGAGALELMVDDQERRSAGAFEGGGAVVLLGGELTRLQLGDPAVGDDPVREPGGQGEEALGVGEQGP